MLNKQAIDKMAEMFTLIKEYGTLGNVEVETEASSEYRRRAWVITKMLSKLTEHEAERDFYSVRSACEHVTYKERERFYRIARQEDRAFMGVLCEYDALAAEFAAEPAGSNEKTETQLVYELELLTVQLSTATARLTQLRGAATEKAPKGKIKDVAAFAAKDSAVISAVAKLDGFQNEFSVATAAAAARGFKVKFTKIRAVVTRIELVRASVLESVKKVKEVTDEPKLTKKAKSALKLVAEPAAKTKKKNVAPKKAA